MFVFELFRRPTKRGVNELEEDINILEALMSEYVAKSREYEFYSVPIHIDENDIEAIENLINKNKELEKMVELMAKDIAENDIDEDICRKVKNIKSEKNDCYGDDYDMCKACVIEFYKKKARENNEP